MTYILIDMGNTYTKYVEYLDKTISPVTKFETFNFAESVKAIEAIKSVKKIIIVSVASDKVTKDVIKKLEIHFECKVQQINTTESIFGIKCGYLDPTLLGADRWVALLAAYHSNRTASLKDIIMVIDCGTVITIDVIDEHGQHLGGWMMPSATLMKNALFDKTNRIKQGINTLASTKSESNVIFGHSTHECIDLGVTFSEVGFIEQCFKQTQMQLKTIPRCILTGGGALDILSLLSMKVEHKPNLIFDGLALFTE